MEEHSLLRVEVVVVRRYGWWWRCRWSISVDDDEHSTYGTDDSGRGRGCTRLRSKLTMVAIDHGGGNGADSSISGPGITSIGGGGGATSYT